MQPFHITKMEEACASKTMVTSHQSTQCHNGENKNQTLRYCENFKSHVNSHYERNYHW